MKKIMLSVSLLALTTLALQAQARTSSIGSFFEHDYNQGYYKCSYKGKVASKKCLLTRSLVKSSVDPRTKSFYGSNYDLPLLTINWPDGDTSRYVFIDSGGIYNLADRKNYVDRNWEGGNLDNGLFIDINKGYRYLSEVEHIRLW